jgi:hypothetical protein
LQSAIGVSAKKVVQKNVGMLMEPDNETALGRPLQNYEDVATELERIAEMVRNTPELNHRAAERLLKIAQDIRSDLDRLGRIVL